MAPRLSHQRIGGDERGKLSSEKREWSHENSAEVSARALFSTSVEDRETVHYLLELHEIRLSPKKIAKTPVD